MKSTYYILACIFLSGSCPHFTGKEERIKEIFQTEKAFE